LFFKEKAVKGGEKEVNFQKKEITRIKRENSIDYLTNMN
jgi:hypothetical protein